MKKAQAGLEFLSTYAWAFIAVTATLSALYYFGAFDFSAFVPQKCVFNLQFKCADFALTPDSVRFRLQNDIGELVRVTSIKVTNDATPPIVCVLNTTTPFDWDVSEKKDVVFRSCVGGGYLPKQRVNLKIQVLFYSPLTPTTPVHTITGRINGKVTT